MRTQTLLLFPIAATLVIGFVNCSQFEPSPVALHSLNAQCVADLRKTAVPSFDVASVCDDAANYVCDHRIFKPGIATARRYEKPCFDLPGLGRACVLTNVFLYDTEANRHEEGLEPGAMDPGGIYNHEEVQCANTAVRSGQVSLINAEAESQEEALRVAYDKCRRGGR